MLTSAYADEMLAVHDASGDLAVFAKPYRPHELAEAVRRLLADT